MNTARAFALVAQRDLRIAFRHRSQLALPLLFFVLVVSLFPLAVSPELAVLRTMAPGIIWVAALLATLLSLDNMFRSDFDDGTLEQLLLSPYPTSVLVFAKILAHWLVTGLPLLLVAPMLGVLTNMQGQSMGVLIVSLGLGTPVLSLGGRHRCRPDHWTEARRGAVVFASLTVVCAGTNLWRERGRCGSNWS